MNFILKHFQIIIHSLDDSLGFFEHLSKDLGLEKIKTNLNFINCIGGCGLAYSDYKRYVCGDCYSEFARYNIDMQLINQNDHLKSKLNKQQPAIINQLSLNQICYLKRMSKDNQDKFLGYILKQLNKL